MEANAQEHYRRDLVRVGLARRFKDLAVIHDPYGECRKRGVEPDEMAEIARNTDIYGRDNRQKHLFT